MWIDYSKKYNTNHPNSRTFQFPNHIETIWILRGYNYMVYNLQFLDLHSGFLYIGRMLFHQIRLYIDISQWIRYTSCSMSRLRRSYKVRIPAHYLTSSGLLYI